MAARLPTSTKVAIIAAVQAGERHADIAVRFGVHESYPRLLAQRGFRDEAALTPEQRQQITAEYVAGKSTKQIAAKYRITEQYVSACARKHGAPPRRKPARAIHDQRDMVLA
ncbi:MAG: hypothetical protein ABIO35_08460 [Nitrobacter sp.]